jgi:cell division protein FtsL
MYIHPKYLCLTGYSTLLLSILLTLGCIIGMIYSDFFSFALLGLFSLICIISSILFIIYAHYKYHKTFQVIPVNMLLYKHALEIEIV